MYTSTISSKASTACENGFHTNSYLQEKNRSFNSPLSCKSFADLEKINAPILDAHSYCQLQECRIDEVRAKSFCDCQISTIAKLKSGSYVEIKRCDVGSVEASGFVLAKESKIANISTKSYAELRGITQLKRVEAKGFIKATNSEIASIHSGSYVELKAIKGLHTIHAHGQVQAAECDIEQLQSKNYIEMAASTVSQVTCAQLEATNSYLESIKSTYGVTLKSCWAIRTVSAQDVIAFQCASLGAIEATRSANLSFCPSVDNVTALEITLKDCTVLHNVTGNAVKVINSVVQQTLTAKNSEMKLVNSHINKLVLEAPLQAPTIARTEASGDIPSNILSLVQAVQSGRLHIIREGSNYCIHFGDLQQRMRNMNLMTMNGIIISASNGVGTLNMYNNQIKVDDLIIPKDKTTVQAAFEFIERQRHRQTAHIDSNNNNNSKVEQKPQRVIIAGGHVAEVAFEVAGGVVIVQDNGSVGTIFQGTVQESTGRAEAEPPNEYTDAVSLDIMRNPCTTPSRQTYDRTTLQRLVNKVTGRIICPLTYQEFSLSDCLPDVGLQAQIEAWLQIHKPSSLQESLQHTAAASSESNIEIEMAEAGMTFTF